MIDNTTCDLSLNPAVSIAVTLCETNDIATCSKGKSSCVYQFYTNMTVIVIIMITSKISILMIAIAVK